MKRRIFVLAPICTLLLVGAFFVRHDSFNVLNQSQTSLLTFSATQMWDEELYSLLRETTQSQQSVVNQLQLALPPSNNSEETKKELSYLHELENKRTSKVVQMINSERNLHNELKFGPVTYGEIQDTTNRPYTAEMFDRVNKDFLPVILLFKEKFDRVRPSYLDPTLTTVIDVPEHPAYPSGHASQVYLFAHMLSLLNPEAEKDFFLAAERVAVNREIAGVHYPSDTQAGKQLADQYIVFLMSQPSFKAMLSKAQTEW